MAHFYLMVIWFAMSLLVAMMGDDRKFGFWGYFFASLLLTPILGFLLMIASDPIYHDSETHKEPTAAGEKSDK